MADRPLLLSASEARHLQDVDCKLTGLTPIVLCVSAMSFWALRVAFRTHPAFHYMIFSLRISVVKVLQGTSVVLIIARRDIVTSADILLNDFKTLIDRPSRVHTWHPNFR